MKNPWYQRLLTPTQVQSRLINQGFLAARRNDSTYAFRNTPYVPQLSPFESSKNQRRIMPPKPDRIRQRHLHGGLTHLVRHVIQVAG